MRAAARTITAKAPIAIPTIGPVPSPDFDEVVAEEAAVVVAEDDPDPVGTDVGAPVAVVVRVGKASTGKYSFGLKAMVAFCV